MRWRFEHTQQTTKNTGMKIIFLEWPFEDIAEMGKSPKMVVMPFSD
jgi:hypothetical protein